MSTPNNTVPPTTFGGWTFYRDNLTLYYKPEDYEVDLERCRTTGEVLDWIAQVQGKAWATPQVVGELVQALCELLDPQATMCSMGKSGSIASSKLPKVVLDNERDTLAHRRLREREDEYRDPDGASSFSSYQKLIGEIRAEVDAMFEADSR
jgi:hypothetical protein